MKTDITLEKIANDQGDLNGVEGMLRGDKQAADQFVKIAQDIAGCIGASAEFLLANMGNQLIHESHYYRTLVKTEDNKEFFYTELRQYLNDHGELVQDFVNGFRGQGYVRPIGATLEALNVLGLAIELKDNYTGGHMKRVSVYCEQLADYFNLPAEAKVALKAAGNKHDIGKISTPIEVLNKPGKLDVEEKEVMDAHEPNGRDLLARVIPVSVVGRDTFLGLVRDHGEPSRTMGYEFLHGIISAADAFDAMTTKRPYRNALSRDGVYDQFNKNRGSQFHPDVADAVLKGVLKPMKLEEKATSDPNWN